MRYDTYIYIYNIYIYIYIYVIRLLKVKEEKKILPKIEQRKFNWIGHILCRNWVLKHVFEGKTE